MQYSTIIEIDGSFGEGGGQIIRTALALSAITKKPFVISRIREKREKSGLQPQHLASVLAASEISQGKVEDAFIGSKKLSFFPGEIKSGNFHFDIGTAGSSVLVLQTIIPILLHGNHSSQVEIIGGTHVLKSPSYDYFSEVFLKAIHRLGCQVKSKMIRPGYYPKGGGCIEVSVEPSFLQGNSNWETDEGFHAIIRLSFLEAGIANREAHILKRIPGIKIQIEKESAFSPGNSLTLWRGFKGVSVLGEKGILAETVAENAILTFEKESETIDEHLADQLLLYAALASGKTHYKTSHFSPHLMTTAHIIGLFLDRKISFREKEVVVE